MRSAVGGRWSAVVVGLWSLVFLLVACQSPAASVTPTVTTVAPAEPTPTTARPPLVFTVAAPHGEQAFRLPPPATAAMTGTPADTPTTAPTPSLISNLQSLTATPAPTFTPPSAPEASGKDHFWLYRPVPDNAAVWTDKVYPYGSTRGGARRVHHGVEFNVPAGTDVLAASAGTVRVAGDDSAVAYGPETDFYGNVVVIEMEGTWNGAPVFTLYGHLSEVLVSKGQRVEARQVIARSGASGVADGPHLHFEVRLGQNRYDATRNPLLWLYPFPNRGVVAGRVTWPSGELVQEVPVSLRRLDAPSAYAGATTYAGNTVNADDGWGENFALDDVVAGYYELSVGGDNPQTMTLWVFPYKTTFVALTLSGES